MLFEKTSKVLQKVKVSGGGRCNVTHHAPNISQLTKNYPRGANQLKKCFGHFNVKDTIAWLEERNVKLKVEEDNRMFPTTDSSQTIINCFLTEVSRLDIQIRYKTSVSSIDPSNGGFRMETSDGTMTFDKVIVATGGSPKKEGLQWLADLGHNIEDPVPSLFTFNIPNDPIKSS